MTNKHFYSWNDIENMCLTITNQMYKDRWLPDYIVGLTRGGNIPATIISNMVNVPCETLKVSLRDDSKLESNAWMAEDAFGSNTGEKVKGSRWDPSLRKNILIVDDINDTGETFNYIKNNFGGEDKVRTASIIHNTPSNFKDLNYYCYEIDKSVVPCWIVFPWEEW